VILRIRPGKADEVIQMAEPVLAPLFRDRAGFVDYRMIRAGEDVGVFVSGWQAKPQAEAAVLGSMSAIKQAGLSMLAMGKLLPAFISFDSYVGQVLFARSAEGVGGIA
jgi:hypothetical protein